MKESQYAITKKDKDGKDQLVAVNSGTPDEGQTAAETLSAEKAGQTFTLWQAVGDFTAKITLKREPYRRKGWDMQETPDTDTEPGQQGAPS